MRKIIKEKSDIRNLYVLSDLHGHRKEFYKMLKEIDFQEEDLLIIDGDVIDRGEESIALLQDIFKMENVILLKGNHEDMMIEGLFEYDFDVFTNWMKNGGGTTYKEIQNLDKSEQNNIYRNLKKLDNAIIVEINGKTYVIVHAGLFFIPGIEIEELLKMQGNNILWIRERFLKSKVKTDYKVIFGHTQTFTIPYELTSYPEYYMEGSFDEKKVLEEAKQSKIWFKDNKIGIDCGLANDGILGCLRLNDMKEFYIEVE